jgi:hypothetical protein
MKMRPADQPVAVEMQIPSTLEIESWKRSGIRLPSQEIQAEAWKYLALALVTAMNYNQYQALSASDLASALLSSQAGLRLEPSLKFEDDRMRFFDRRDFTSELEQLRSLRSQVQDELVEVRKMRDTLQTLGPRVVVIRQIDENQAEDEIVSYLKSHKHADTGELVENLGIDIDLVLKVVQHLKEQGKVESVDTHKS